MRYSLLLLLACCGPSIELPTCRTKCGLQLIGALPPATEFYNADDERWSCAAIQRAEDAAIVEFTRIDDYRFRDTCEEIGKYSFSLVSSPTFQDSIGRSVTGVTYCHKFAAAVSNVVPSHSALLHEMAHMVQQCGPGSCTHPGTDDFDHWCWESIGVHNAIWRAQVRMLETYNAREP